MFSRASNSALQIVAALVPGFGSGEWVLAADLAALVDRPPPSVAKVLQALARKRILRSQRGRQGGFQLAVPPGELTVWEVVRCLDDLGQLDGCVMSHGECDADSPCALHRLWVDLREQLVERMRATTLSQLAAAADGPLD